MKNLKIKMPSMAMFTAIIVAVVLFASNITANAETNRNFNFAQAEFEAKKLANKIDLTQFPDWMHSDTNWWVVNNTKKESSYNNGIPGHAGSFISGYLNNQNCFKLTDTFPAQSVIMYNKRQIDLTKDFEFRFKIFFGSGKHNTLYTNYGIADGILFFLTNKDTTNLYKTIGAAQNKLGYASMSDTSDLNTFGYDTTLPNVIDSSMACEFDTEYTGYIESGHMFDVMQHISILRNGYVGISNHNNDYKQIQNNRGNILSNAWYCAKIKWIVYKTNGNIDSCKLKVYLQEHATGPLILRLEQTHLLSSGLSNNFQIDSNGKCMVNWGIASATCSDANLHAIEFLSMTNQDSILLDDAPALFVQFKQNCNYNSVTGENDMTNIYSHLPPAFRRNDTLYNYDGASCSAYQSNPYSDIVNGDTIGSTVACGDEGFFCQSTLVINAKGERVTGIYINDEMLTDEEYITYDINGYYYVTDDKGNINIDFDAYRHLWQDKQDIVVKIDINGQIYTILIEKNDNKELAEKINALNVDEIKDGIVGVNNENLSKTMKIPSLINGCPVEIMSFDSSAFTEAPTKIEENGTCYLKFTLLEDCIANNTEIKLGTDCICSAEFTFSVNNLSCDTTDTTETDTTVCDEVEITNEFSYLPDTVDALTGFPSLITTYSSSYLNINSSNKNIIEIQVSPVGNNENENNDDLISHGPGMHWRDTKIDFNGKKGHVELAYFCAGMYPSCVRVPVEVCVTLENDIVCCDTVGVDFYCNGIKWIGLSPNPATDLINVSYELYELPQAPIPLNIALYDQNGNKKIDIMKAVPTQLEDTINANVSSLQVGNYYVIFQYGSQIEIVPFIKN